MLIISDVCDGAGLVVGGYYNRIENNMVAGPGSLDDCAKGFSLHGHANVYRGNTVQGFDHPFDPCQ